MPRIRSIKPEVHLDEGLWDAEQETGLPLFRAFTALWCYADREGRFEWRPRMLKAGCLPYWEGDFSRVLDACVTRGFLQKYTVDGREYGLVRTFTRHQVINNRETQSIIPPPPRTPTNTSSSTREAPVDDACPTREGCALGEGKGREGKGREARVPGTTTVRDVAAVFREVAGHDLPNDIDMSWDDRAERQPVMRMLKWCSGDLPKLRAKLETLSKDDWLSGQGVEQWAKRIGTNPKPRNGSASGPATPPKDFKYDDADTTL